MAKKKLADIEEEIEEQTGLNIKDLEKIIGGPMMTISELEHKECIGTGIMSLDLALIRPLPLGSASEIFGAEGTGKTTLALQIISHFQRTRKEPVYYFDVEHKLNRGLIECIDGVNYESMYLGQPADGTKALAGVEKIIRTTQNSLIVIDSIPALIPDSVLKKGIEDQHMGKLAKLMSEFVGRVAHPLYINDHHIIFINQIRDNLAPYGGGVNTPGGHAVKHIMQQRMYMKRLAKGELKDSKSGKVVGHTGEIMVIKNGLAKDKQQAEVPFIHGEGVKIALDLATCARTSGVVRKGGAFYYFTPEGKDEINFRGLPELVSELEINEAMAKEVKERILKAYEIQDN